MVDGEFYYFMDFFLTFSIELIYDMIETHSIDFDGLECVSRLIHQTLTALRRQHHLFVLFVF